MKSEKKGRRERGFLSKHGLISREVEAMAGRLEVGPTTGLQVGEAGGLEAGMTVGLEAGMTVGLEAGMTGGLEAGMTGGLEAGMVDGDIVSVSTLERWWWVPW